MNPPPIPAGSKEGPGHSAPLLISKGFSYQTSAQALKYKPICLFLPLEFAILRILSKSKNKMGKVTYRSAGKAKKKKKESPEVRSIFWVTQLELLDGNKY